MGELWFLFVIGNEGGGVELGEREKKVRGKNQNGKRGVEGDGGVKKREREKKRKGG